MEENVVLFPKAKKNTPDSTLEEVRANVAQNQQEVATDMALKITQSAYVVAGEMGFDLGSHAHSAKDFLYSVEAIKSMILRSVAISHPFQDSAEEYIEIENDPATLEYLLNYE